LKLLFITIHQMLVSVYIILSRFSLSQFIYIYLLSVYLLYVFSSFLSQNYFLNCIEWRFQYSICFLNHWFSLVKLSQKAVIRKICLFLRLYTVVPSKKRKSQYANRVNLSSLLFILQRHYRHIFTGIYRFHKINSCRHDNIMAFELRYYNADSYQRRYGIRNWTPMFIGTPCILVNMLILRLLVTLFT